MPAPLDDFMPVHDVAERFETTVRAPADFVLAVARELDLQSIFLVRAIFWLRTRFTGAAATPRRPQGLVAETLGVGWGVLRDEPGRVFVAGATCQPWQANVAFRPVPAADFVAYTEPDHVTIAWTLEAIPLGPALTRFASETRAVATDAEARRKFLRYWRWARFGIVAIRRLLLPAVRRQAEAEWRRVEANSSQ